MAETEEATEQDVDSFVDFRGNTVEVGDTIAYAVSHGSNAELATGVVERIYKKKSTWQADMQQRLRVRRTERAFGQTYGDSSAERTGKPSRPSTLMSWKHSILVEKADG